VAFDYAKYFGEIKLTQDLLTKKEERSWLLTPPRDGERHDVVLYLGCNVLRTSHMIRTVTAIFDRLGLDYVAVGGPTYCCGIVHHREGDTAAGDGMARRTLELFKRYEPDEVVMWCPSCIYFYDEVQHLPMPVPFRQAAEFLVEQLPRLTFSHEVRQRVALHSHADPETFVVVAGELDGLTRYAHGSAWVPLHAGDIFHVPGDVPHAWRNRSTQPATALVLTTTRRARFFCDIAAPASCTHTPDPEVIATCPDVARRYGHWTATPEENAAIGLRVAPWP